jgi:hypothetical protein
MFYYFTLWRQDGLDQRIQEILRCQVRERSRRVRRPATSPAPAWDASFTRDYSSNPDVADLDLLPVEVEQNGTVGEPRVVRDVPKQPGTCQSLPGQCTQVVIVGGGDRGTAAMPVGGVGLEVEIEHPSIVSGEQQGAQSAGHP